MLRAVLAIVLIAIVGGIAFYAGRATAPSATPQAAVNPPQSAQQPAAPPPDTTTRARSLEPPASPPEIAATPSTAPPPGAGPAAELPASPAKAMAALDTRIGLPIAGLKSSDLQDSFNQSRTDGEHAHEATDIMAERGTPVLAATTGIIKKLFNSKPGGLTIYQFDSAEQYCFYYAHLDRYAEGLREGQLVKKGGKIGYVGSTGNANPAAPHLHFAIFELGPEKRWYEGKPLNPYPLLMQALK
jgi:peptidoglycan LD-endopeptidase LytH